MDRLTPLRDGIRVKSYVEQHQLRNIALVFLHGLGDTLMFRSVYRALREELPDVSTTLFLLESQEVLIEGARPWRGEECLRDFEAAFILEFPMSEGTGCRKADYCARHELGLAGSSFEIEPLELNANRLAAVHFQGTALPDAVNPSPSVCRAIYDALTSRGYLPIEVHFEHGFHNPVNAKFDWLSTTLRGNSPSVEKLYSVLRGCSLFVGVASGPLIMAMAIDPRKVIFLEKDFALSNYTAAQVRTIDVRRFRIEEFLALLDNRPCPPPDPLEASIHRVKGELTFSDQQLLGEAIQWEHEHFPAYLASNEYYCWYFAVAKVLRPRRIAEIGVRYGYSLTSLAMGTLDEGGFDRGEVQLIGFDNECYNQGSLAVAADHLRGRLGLATEMRRTDTQSLTSFDLADIDLFHVDGDHTYRGALHDCELAYRCLRPGGVLLVDDVASVPDVKKAADDFCARHDLRPFLLPTYRGLYVVPTAK